MNQVKVARAYYGGRTDETFHDVDDFPEYDNYQQIWNNMKKNNCHSIFIELPDGLQILFTRKDLK